MVYFNFNILMHMYRHILENFQSNRFPYDFVKILQCYCLQFSFPTLRSLQHRSLSFLVPYFSLILYPSAFYLLILSVPYLERSVPFLLSNFLTYVGIWSATPMAKLLKLPSKYNWKMCDFCLSNLGYLRMIVPNSIHL